MLRYKSTECKEHPRCHQMFLLAGAYMAGIWLDGDGGIGSGVDFTFNEADLKSGKVAEIFRDALSDIQRGQSREIPCKGIRRSGASPALPVTGKPGAGDVGTAPPDSISRFHLRSRLISIPAGKVNHAVIFPHKSFAVPPYGFRVSAGRSRSGRTRPVP